MITAIEAQKRNKDKVNLYLDGEFACSLTAESVVRARLKIGQELSEEKLREILATSETELAFKKALDYISRAMKTEKQVKDYLCLKGFDALAAERAVEKLKEYKYADDLQFAALYVEMNGRQKGARRIKAELMQRGLTRQKRSRRCLCFRRKGRVRARRRLRINLCAARQTTSKPRQAVEVFGGSRL